MHKQSPPAILMVSNFLRSTRHNKNVWHYLAERLADDGWNVLTASSKEMRLLRLMDMVWKVLTKSKRYDLAQVDVFSGKAFIFAEVCVWLLNRLNKPVVLTLHGGGLPDFAERYPRRIKHLLASADRVVTPSPFLQTALSEFNDSIDLIPNPIDLCASIYRHRKSVMPRLIWVRAFHQTYNPTMAIELIRDLLAEYPDIHLTMIGPDKEDDSFERTSTKILDFGLENHVEVIPGVEHNRIPALLDRADIFINTSNFDTAPRSLIEAMANGLCIVTTNVGGIPYLVADQKDALLVPPNQTQKMADAVRQLLTDEDLAAQLSLNARLRAEEHDWSAILPKWKNLFITLAGEKHG